MIRSQLSSLPSATILSPRCLAASTSPTASSASPSSSSSLLRSNRCPRSRCDAATQHADRSGGPTVPQVQTGEHRRDLRRFRMAVDQPFDLLHTTLIEPQRSEVGNRQPMQRRHGELGHLQPGTWLALGTRPVPRCSEHGSIVNPTLGEQERATKRSVNAIDPTHPLHDTTTRAVDGTRSSSSTREHHGVADAVERQRHRHRLVGTQRTSPPRHRVLERQAHAHLRQCARLKIAITSRRHCSASHAQLLSDDRVHRSRPTTRTATSRATARGRARRRGA